MNHITAQAIGWIAFALGVISLQFKSPRTILLLQMSGNVAFAIHYLLLGAYTACVGQIVLIFNIVAICRAREVQICHNKAWKWLFSFLALTTCAVSWQDGFSILPCGAALVTILTNWTFDTKTIRLGKLLLSCPAWVVYDLHVGSYSGVLCECVCMVSALLAIICQRKISREI